MSYTGVINVYKEKGYTSHDVVAILRRLTASKTGHTGTLDPQAEGVLPICLGRATKLADYIMTADKTYVAELVLGITTDTADMTGEVLTRADADTVAKIDTAAVERAAAEFIGEIQQVPPMYSAIKIGGKKLYELARKGEVVERKPRRVKIRYIKILDENKLHALLCIPQALQALWCTSQSELVMRQRFFIEVSCSKGTYIRSLCADIGEKLGCGAAMGALTRTRSGLFFLENAVKIGVLRTAAQEGRLGEYVLPVDEILPYPRAVVSDTALTMALNGNPILLEKIKIMKVRKKPHFALPDRGIPPFINGDKLWLFSPEGNMIGLFSFSTDNLSLRAEVML